MMGRKLRDSRGETLVELLASILIAALSVALLFTCCMAAAEMGRETRAADQKYYEVLTAAEKQDGPAESAAVTVEKAGTSAASKSIEVGLYGGEGMYSYRLPGEGGASGDP